ncbi:hypothetical protein CEXT_282461 [Caerostris extrusa]|uniref:Uncharacterized protein n=1 Tax=Caerostris extrusa TaxID=172846 RepID=A0AAV4W9R4_CAEEX|nr:hypothetical protein CEXT_282461 [Caerostris extrusa]
MFCKKTFRVFCTYTRHQFRTWEVIPRVRQNLFRLKILSELHYTMGVRDASVHGNTDASVLNGKSWLEPGTFRVLGGCDNHYTMGTDASVLNVREVMYKLVNTFTKSFPVEEKNNSVFYPSSALCFWDKKKTTFCTHQGSNLGPSAC